MLDSCVRLLPRVPDGEAYVGQGMTDVGWWEPVADQPRHTVPRECILLAASPERAPPEVSHPMPERRERPDVGQHRIIGEMAGDHLLQPCSLDRDRLTHASPKLNLQFHALGTSPIGPGDPPPRNCPCESIARRCPRGVYEPAILKAWYLDQ